MVDGRCMAQPRGVLPDAALCRTGWFRDCLPFFRVDTYEENGGLLLRKSGKDRTLV